MKAGVRYLGLILLASASIDTVWGADASPKIPIRVVIEAWAPLAGPDLPHQGPLFNLLTTIFQGSDYVLDLRYYPWARCLEMARRGEADILLGAFHSTERARYLAYPQALCTLETAVYGLASRDFSWEQYEDLKGFRIGVVRYAVNGEVFDQVTKQNQHPLVNLSQCIDLLFNNRVDLVAGTSVVVEHLLIKRPLDQRARVVQVGPPLSTQNVYAAVSRASPHESGLLEVINHRLVELKAGGTWDHLVKESGIH